MDLTLFNNFNYQVWYRGLKNLTVSKITDNSILFSNNDKIVITDGEIYLNNKLFSNIPDINQSELSEMYLNYLTKKGYKFL